MARGDAAGMLRAMSRATSSALLVTALAAALIAAPAHAAFLGSNGRIVFASDCSLYSVSADGTGRQKHTTPPYGACDGFDGGGAISPDGMRAAFSRTTRTPAGNRQSDIYVVDLGTETLTQITSTPDVTEIHPTWAPDGERIAFIARTRILGDEAYGGLHMINIRTGAQQQLTKGLDAAPDWSPDGRRIAFARIIPNVDTILMTRDVASGSEARLYEGGAADPDWSPDGTRVVFQDTKGAIQGSNDGIWTVYADPSNTRPRRLIAGTLSAGGDMTTPYTPVWAPDGTKIAFTRGGVSGLRRDIRQINADGSSERVLFKSEALWLKDPDWQPVKQLLGGLLGNVCLTLCSETTSILSLSTTLGILPITRLLFEDPTDAADNPQEAIDDVEEATDDTVNNIGFPNVLNNQHIIYRTVVRRSDGQRVTRETEGIVGQPQPIDADYDRTPDVIAETTPVANLSAVRLCVTRVSTALDPCVLPGTSLIPADLPAKPMSVEVLFSDALAETGSVEDPTHIAFGYDALASRTPRLFDATLGKSGESRFDSHVVTAGAQSPMSLIADVRTTGAEERWTQGRLTFAPVPASLDLALDTGDPAVEDAPLRMETRVSQDSLVTAHVEDSAPREPLRVVDAVINRLPATTRPGQLLGQMSFGGSYRGSDKRLDLDAGRTIDRVDFEYSEGIASDTQRLDVVATTVPSELSLDLSSPTTDVLTGDYDASGVLGSLTLDITGTRSLGGPADEFHLFAQGIPAHLDFRLNDELREIIDARGGQIDLVEAQLIDHESDRNANRLPAGKDGVFLRDSEEHLALFVRATQLRRLQLTRKAPDNGACGLDLRTCAVIDKAAASPLRIDLETPSIGFLRTELSSLQAGATTFKFGSEEGRPMRISYLAPNNAPGSTLTLDTNAANAVRNLHVDLAPVPARLEVCQSSELQCGPSRADIPSNENQAFWSPVIAVDIQARNALGQLTPVTVNLDLDEWAVPDGAEITNLKFSKLVFQASSAPDDGGCGTTPLYFYADTDGLPISGDGRIVSTCGGSDGVELDTTKVTFHLPVGEKNFVWAQNRYLITDDQANTSEEGGDMHCPGTTTFLFVGQDLFGNDVDMQQELCSSGGAV